MAKDTFKKISEMLVYPSAGFRHLFAHSEFMAEDRLRELGSEAEFVCVAYYESRRWIVNSEGIASVIPRRGHQVHGVIWRIPEIELAALDIYLGVPSNVERFGALAYLPNGRRITSEYYGTKIRELGAASAEYLAPILKAGRERGLPDSYVEEMAAWINGAPHSDSARGLLA